MAYEKQIWEDKNPNYPADAERFTHIEQGIVDEESERIAQVKEAETKAITSATAGVAAAITSGIKSEREAREAGEATKASLVSPAFTGIATVPTASEGTKTFQIANTEFVDNAVSVSKAALSTEIETEKEERTAEDTNINSTLTLKAPLASPTFTGTPIAPTAAAKTETTQIATTKFAQIAAGEALTTAEGKITTAETNARVSPSLSGTPTSPTAAPGTNTTQIATTAFVITAANSAQTAAEATTTALASKTVNKTNEPQSIEGVKTFVSSPIVPEPASHYAAATKGYVDANASGLVVHAPAQVATSAALPASSYVTGVITATSNEALSIDTIKVSINWRVLVKNQVAEANNGIYVVTHAGGASEKWVLTRAVDMETAEQIKSAYVFIEEGSEASKQEDSSWRVQGEGPWTLGTTAIVWGLFSRAGAFTAGEGLNKIGTTLSVKYGTIAGSAAQGNDSRITGAAPTASPTLTGTPLAPTAAESTNTTQIATTSFVHTVATKAKEEAETNIKVSPTFTGTPSAPNPAKTTNTAQIATTKMVQEVTAAAKEEAEAAAKLSPSHVIEAPYTILVTDANKTLDCKSASVLKITVPTLPVGTVVNICQAGEGKVELVGSTASLAPIEELEFLTRTKNSTISLRWRTATEVVVAGDLQVG